MTWQRITFAAALAGLTVAVSHRVEAASVGNILACGTGSWTNSPTSYQYQFLRDAAVIQSLSATNTYTIVTADQGHSLTCQSTATNGSGTSALSTASAAVTVPAGTAIAHVQDAYASQSGNVASLPFTLNSTVAGNFFVVFVRAFNVASGATGFAVATNNGTTCTVSPGTFQVVAGGSNPWSGIAYCMNNAAAGTVNFTATFTTPSSNQVTAPSGLVAEFSGVNTTGADAGVGASMNGTNVTNLTESVSTNGSVTQTGALVVSMNSPTAVNPTSMGGSQTAFANNSTFNFSYQIVTTAGAVTHTYTYPAGTNVYTGSIAAFTHP